VPICCTGWGEILAISPGQAGIAVWSSPIDHLGNSVRGIRVCQEISRAFSLHVHPAPPGPWLVVAR
jgi:glutaminase